MGLNVTVMGPPGAGKGTQAERFARRRGLPKISTGEVLREGIKEELPVALMAKAKMDLGELVDDDTMVAIVRNRLAKPDTTPGFVLDGFPRTVPQAVTLDRIMEDRRDGPLIVVDIVVPDGELARRLAGRRICSQCGTNAAPEDVAATTCTRCGGTLVERVDDDKKVVLERLRVYARMTRPLVDYYRVRPTFRTVNGAQASDRVARDLDAAIDDAASFGGGVSMGAQGGRPGR